MSCARSLGKTLELQAKSLWSVLLLSNQHLLEVGTCQTTSAVVDALFYFLTLVFHIENA